MSLSSIENVGVSLSLSNLEKAKILAIYFVLISLTLLGFAGSVVVGNLNPVLASLGVVCFVLGLRHGFDADHIAAIDNTTRKLIHEGKKPFTVGTWFSLGHSTVVVALIVALIYLTKIVVGVMPALQSVGALAGTLVSGVFLIIIGLVNTLIVFDIYRVFKKARVEKVSEDELEKMLNKRGFMNRFFNGLFKLVEESWQIYPIGLLFGLGFDTATEVALIAISVGVGVSSSAPLWMILVLPFLFTCGMVLVDTSDGVVMRLAYGWAFLNPMRKVFYNLTVTVISVLVAFVIGGIELIQVLSTELNLTGSFFAFINNLDFESVGYVVVAVFIFSWLAAMFWWNYKKYDKNKSFIS